MSWTKRLPLIAVALIITLSAPAVAHAQRGGRRGPAARPVIVAPYFYSPFYSPFFFDPFFGSFYGWGYPGWFGPGSYNRFGVEESSARIQVTPKQAEVYVDGYLAGSVDDFDGMAQRLRVSPGEHVIELYLDGHKSIAQTIMFQRGQSYRIKHAMEALAAGETASPRPTPKPGTPAPAGARTGSALAIRVQPGDASVIVDGERWQSSGDRLEIQVSPGKHRIEVQKDGYQPFSTTVRVRPGETSPINVSLTKSGEE